MALPESGPCEPWCTWEQVVLCSPAGVLDEVDTELQEQFIAEASERLWNLSSQRYPGECTRTVVPCVACSCGCSPCCCDPAERVDLGYWPVGEVLEVIVDGAALAESAYRVDQWRWLVRQDGGVWPRCVDLGEETAADAFSVTFTFGAEIPIGAQMAAARLAQFYAFSCPSVLCQLPERVAQITREGVSYVFENAAELQKEGLTGIGLVDAWLLSERWADDHTPEPQIWDPADCSRLHEIDTGAPPLSA